MYEYNAKVIIVNITSHFSKSYNLFSIDLDIDLGFNLTIKKTISLYAVAPLVEKQQEALIRISQLIPKGTIVKVSTLKDDTGIIYLNNLNIGVQLIQERLAMSMN